MFRRTQNLVLQRRHFEFIADTIRQLPNHPDLALVGNIFAAALRATNSQFDTARFLAACDGVPYKRTKRAAKPVKPQPEGQLSLKEIHQAKRMVDHAK